MEYAATMAREQARGSEGMKETGPCLVGRLTDEADDLILILICLLFPFPALVKFWERSAGLVQRVPAKADLSLLTVSSPPPHSLIPRLTHSPPPLHPSLPLVQKYAF
jgi:hypothetical protein